MQIYTIVIGGLEKSYMQKLVLYLNERLGKSARVELLEHWEILEQPEVWEMKKQSVGVPMEGSKCWDTGIGSEAFITYLAEQHLVNHTLTVTAQKCTEKAVVYQYQPRDCLYREIVSKCPMNVGGRQKWSRKAADSGGWYLPERVRVEYLWHFRCFTPGCYQRQRKCCMSILQNAVE